MLLLITWVGRDFCFYKINLLRKRPKKRTMPPPPEKKKKKKKKKHEKFDVEARSVQRQLRMPWPLV